MFNSITVAAALLVASVFTGHSQALVYFGQLAGNPLNGGNVGLMTSGVSTNNVVLSASTNTYFAAYTQTNTVLTNGVIAGTNTLNVVASTNMAVIKDANKVTITCMYNMNGLAAAAPAGSTNAIFRIDSSGDGANWVNGVTNITVPYAGSGNVSIAAVNMETYGNTFWRIGQIQNTNSLALSNIVSFVTRKPGGL